MKSLRNGVHRANAVVWGPVRGERTFDVRRMRREKRAREERAPTSARVRVGVRVRVRVGTPRVGTPRVGAPVGAPFPADPERERASAGDVPRDDVPEDGRRVARAGVDVRRSVSRASRRGPPQRGLRAVLQANVRVELRGVRSGVERRRGRVLKARDPGRRETPAKVLKDRRSPRERGRMGTSVERA